MQQRRENGCRTRVPFLTAVAIQPSHVPDWIRSYTAQTICLHCFCFIFDNVTLIHKVLCSYLLLISLPFSLTPSFSQRIPLLLPCLLCVRVQVLSITAAVCLQLRWPSHIQKTARTALLHPPARIIFLPPGPWREDTDALFQAKDSEPTVPIIRPPVTSLCINQSAPLEGLINFTAPANQQSLLVASTPSQPSHLAGQTNAAKHRVTHTIPATMADSQNKELQTILV